MQTDTENLPDNSVAPMVPPAPGPNGHDHGIVGEAVPTGTANGARGTVKWFNEKKGFGFIVDPEVPTDIFVHFSAINADGFRTLTEGDQVAYELYRDDKGAKARNVVRL